LCRDEGDRIMEGGQLQEREHWRALAPDLHIEDWSLFENVAYLELSPPLAAQFKDDGYLQASTDWCLDLGRMADTVRALSAANLSPLFAFVYDEFWYPFFRMRPLLGALLGGSYCLLPEFWILNVDPKKGEAGWRPHRDRGRRALLDDGSPKSLTAWIPLSTSTSLNGCLYIVPAQQDPTYATADEAEMKFDYQSIRALPGRPGDFVIWNQALFHWGGRSSPHAAESRVSMAVQFQRADVPAFDSPLIDPLRVPPFEARVKLIARQLYRYRHMYELDPKVVSLACDQLDQSYLVPAPAGAGESVAPAARRIPDNSSSWAKVGRNQPCPCGSGKKYKQCHGALG
jgi:SEC-C motif/Phytanoyl-CoA dioxygenase (PhyH)